MDLQKIRDMTLHNLRIVVSQGDTFMPVAFLNGEKEAVVGCPFSDDTKILVLQQVGAMAHKLHSTEIFVVTDAYMRTIDPKDIQRVQDNWDTERPSTYPSSMRVDCLVISKIVPNNPKEDKVLTIIYEVKNKEVIIKREEEITEFDGAIKDAILTGYHSGLEPQGFRSF